MIVDIDKPDTFYFDQLFGIPDIPNIPSQLEYEDSATDPSRNPLQFDLEQYILDSIRSVGIKFDNLKYNEMYGYNFVHPRQHSVYPLNLTMFLARHAGRFKIIAYHSVRYNYDVPVVPRSFGDTERLLHERKADGKAKELYKDYLKQIHPASAGPADQPRPKEK